MAKKKKLKVVKKKKVKRKKNEYSKGTLYTAHMNDMIKRIAELEARVAELEKSKKKKQTWAGYPNELKN